MRIALTIQLIVLALSNRVSADFSIEEKADRVVVSDDTIPIANYVFRDETIRRPYWAHVRGPGGLRLTRTHPPVEGKDPTDHATMHPGIWLAFGDVGGEDFWRNKGLVRHDGFNEAPAATANAVRFSVTNTYVTASGSRTVARETCRYQLLRRPNAFLLTIDSTIAPAASDAPAIFGDQEEMGLGVRVASELTAKNGGVIVNSNGEKHEKGTWGKSADWCHYFNTMGDRRTGIAVLAHPGNFAPSRFHSRDYGLLVANPFAVDAFRAGPKARTPVTPEKPLRLRFGVVLHDAHTPPDIATEYKALASDTR